MEPAMLETVDALVDMLQKSPEYQEYGAARAILQENDFLYGVYKSYQRLQFQAQAGQITGTGGDAAERFQRYGELLQLHEESSRFLLAEYNLHNLLGDIYKRLAGAIDIDLSALE